MRPPIERYIRCSVDIPSGSVEVGLQREPPTGNERVTIRQLVHVAYMRSLTVGGLDEPRWSTMEEFADIITPDLEKSFSQVWPDRAWFVEIWNETEALSQVYQPYGMPRST